MTVAPGLRRPRKLLLGALVLSAALFFGLQSTAQASHYSVSLVFEFHNKFPSNTEVKVVRRESKCATIHTSNPREVGNDHRVHLGHADIDTGPDCFWKASDAYLKLENARTGSVLAYLNVFQQGPRKYDVQCKPGDHANPKVSRCSGGDDPLGPRWFWRIVH